MIPPALLKLCFFDGERIAEYLLDDQKNNVRDALMVLSGNDTFDIMYSNVRKVLTSSSSEEDDITREYLQSKSTLKRLRQTRDRLADEIAELQAQQDEKNADIERLKKEYSDQGGISLDEWKTLNTQLKERKSVENASTGSERPRQQKYFRLLLLGRCSIRFVLKLPENMNLKHGRQFQNLSKQIDSKMLLFPL